jgi:hypothetical protein
LLEESGFELLVPLVDAALDALADDLALELRCRVDEEFVPDSPLEEDGFELQVPFLEKLCRVLSKGNAER